MFTLTQNRRKIDDALGAWPPAFSARRRWVAWALLEGVLVYGTLKFTMGLRLSQEEEHEGADLSIHRISATLDREVNW